MYPSIARKHPLDLLRSHALHLAKAAEVAHDFALLLRLLRLLNCIGKA